MVRQLSNSCVVFEINILEPYYSILWSNFDEKWVVLEQFELKEHNILLESFPQVLTQITSRDGHVLSVDLEMYM